MGKCIKHVDTGAVDRVSKVRAAKMVATGKWQYIPKSAYKRADKLPEFHGIQKHKGGLSK